MYTIDLHNSTTYSAIANLDKYLSFGRKEKDRLIKFITGYGKSNGSHKIKTALLNKLEEYKLIKKIKDYLDGSNNDMFKEQYHKFLGKNVIPEDERTKANSGIIYVFV